MSCAHDDYIEFDGVPVLFVNPAEPDIAEIKHTAAVRGQSVVVSVAVPVGKRYFAPSGTPRFPTG